MSFFTKLKTAAKKSIASAQSARDSVNRQLEAHAKMQMKQAKTRLQQERVRANLALAKAKLERETYEAIVAAQNEKRAATEARHRAGRYTTGEKLARFGAGFGRDLGRAYKTLSTPDKPRRRKATTKRRTTRR